MNPLPGSLDQLHADASAIFTHALKACDIPAAFDRHLRFEGKTLIRQSSPHIKPVTIPLDQYKKILVIAFGKAALTMTDTLLKRLPPKVAFRGICSAPDIPAKHTWRIRYYAGGHPLPNAESFKAAREALKLLKRARRDTFVFFLISGGGSAMLELPRDPGNSLPRISLSDTIAFHETLIASGATITEINTVRKYFSAVKGGRLALAAPAAEKLSLLLADVPLKDLAAVASSPTLPDRSTPQQCREILDRFHLLEKFPQAVREYFESLNLGASAQPSESEAIEHSQFDTLLSNHDFVNAARDHARSLGYHVIIDNTCDDWGYREASQYLLKRFHELRREFPRLCLLSSGEVTVKLEGHTGCGGRNQHFALATALELARNADDRTAVLSAGSDGIDGNSPAAGAVADPTTVLRARAYGFDPEATLARFDSCTLFSALGDTVVTGPTGNNLRDLRILLASRAASQNP
jgi:hydroxypyruvate reductase